MDGSTTRPHRPHAGTGTRRPGHLLGAVAGLVSLAAVTVPPWTPAHADPPDATVDAAVVDDLASDGVATFWVYLDDHADLAAAHDLRDRSDQGRYVYEELTTTARVSQSRVVSILDEAGADYESFWIANTIKVTGTADVLDEIADLPEVAEVTADRTYAIPEPEPATEEDQINSVEWNVDRVKAPQVWSEFGVTGEDIVIGSIDTGVQYTHPALVEQYRGNNGDGTFTHDYNWWDPSNVCGAPSLAPCDNNNHGTHTVGTMVGDDGAGNAIGVAPGARWIAAKGCESTSCSQSALLSAGQFMLAPTDLQGNNPDPEKRPHVVNNSWGGSATTDPWYRPTVQAWVAAGIFPQFSSGNPGSACGAAGNPGNLPEAYAAGAFDINGGLYVNSGRGPSAWGSDLVKPNIAAPGVSVRSSIAGDGYGSLTGTSMASPHVAATVALMWSAAPALARDIDATRAILDGTAADTQDLSCGGTAANNNVWGQGKLDAYGAVDQSPIPEKGQVGGIVADAATSTPIVGATVSITGPVQRTRRTGDDGRYGLVLPVGDYDVTASAFGYEPTTSTVTVVASETVAADFALEPPAGSGLDVSPATVDFGITEVGEDAGPETVTLTGTGAEPVTIDAISAPSGDFALVGGSCSAPPIVLGHQESCTLDYTFAPSADGPAQTEVAITSSAPGSPHTVVLRGNAITIPERDVAVTLDDGENIPMSAVVDPDGDYAYVGTQTSPGRVVKIDLDTMRRVDAIVAGTGENFLGAAVIDPTGRYAYFGTHTAPGRVVKVDLATFRYAGSIVLGEGYDYLRTAVMDTDGRYAYFGTGSAPGHVVKVDLATFDVAGAVTLADGAGHLRSAVIAPDGEAAYFGSGTAPGVVTKIDLATFAPAGYLPLAADGELYSAAIDPAGRYAYFGTGDAPGRVVKIDLADFTRAAALELAPGESGLISAAMDPDGSAAYFGTNTSPGQLVKIDLATFARVGTAPLADGENAVLSTAMDPDGSAAYVGVLASPGRVARVQLVSGVGSSPSNGTASPHGTGAADTVAADRIAADTVESWTDTSGQPADRHGRRPAGVESGSTAAPASTSPQDDAAWTLLGPPGGDISDVAVSPADPDLVLAGMAPNGLSGGTVYRSIDAGATWSKVPAMSGRSVFDIDFATDGTVYAGTMDGVWTSTNGGVDWAPRDLGIGVNDQVFDVAFDPDDPSVIWAGIGDALGFQNVNLMRSTDGGQTWADATPPIGVPLSGRTIALDPNDPDTVIAGFDSAQVWVTTDGGATWTNRSSGLPSAPLSSVVYDGSRLLVGGGQLSGENYFGLYQSTDLGVTWTPLHDATWPAPVVNDIAVDPNDAATILVVTAGHGVHRTTDGGATWELTIGGTAGLNGRSLGFVADSSDEVFLSTDTQAVLRSSDGGDTFAQSAHGISEFNVFDVHANPIDPDEIAIAYQGTNNGGVYTSTDAGTTWTAESVPATRYSSVRFAPDGTLYALSTGPSSVAPEGLYRRETDGGWTLLGPDQGPLFESELATIRFSAVDSDLILLGGADFGVAGSEATIWRSEDRGETWTKAYEGTADSEAVRDIAWVADGSDQAAVASYESLAAGWPGGVLWSGNGGRGWARSTIGLPSGTLRAPQVCAAAGDPHSFYLAAGLALGNITVYRTTDGGVTWWPTGATVEANGADLACDPRDDRVIYLTASGTTPVLRSTDGGATIAPFSSGLDGVRSPRALSFASDSSLLLATGTGTFRTDLQRDDITLTGRGVRERGEHVVYLAWTGATSDDVDVYRDGVLVASVPNDGEYRDLPERRNTRSYTYQVCRADSSVCSDEVTVRIGDPG